MKQTAQIMGMPITVEILDMPTEPIFQKVFDYFRYVDEKFSTYKVNSEISKINRGELLLENASEDMKKIFAYSEQTKQQSNDYFNIQKPDGQYDPSGLVKGWAIYEASNILESAGHINYFVDAGSDIQVSRPKGSNPWRVGIRNPHHHSEIVKVVYLTNEGMATSGTYARGQHIYNPHNPNQKLTEVISLSVIGPNIYEADRFATAAFAMGVEGINFIEKLEGFEGYQMAADNQATFTSGFDKYTK